MISQLRSQFPIGLLGVSADTVELSWLIEPADGPAQESYQIQVSNDPQFETVIADSGTVGGPLPRAIAPGGAACSREIRFYRVRITTSQGHSPWSEPLELETGLLDCSDWVAAPIGMAGDPGATEMAPPPMLRREFSLAQRPTRARLYVTALGVYELEINGTRVGLDYLNPGWTSYGKRVLATTYDVTDLLVVGDNVIGGTIADGWFRGKLGFAHMSKRGWYGDELALIAQLEIECDDGPTTVVATDETWKVSTGEVRSADLYDGACLDLRKIHDGWSRPGFDDGAWAAAAIIDWDLATVEPQLVEPVRVVDTLDAVHVGTVGKEWIFDGGQNMSGFVRLTVRGDAGDEITVRHAEVLQPEGELYVENLRSAVCTDSFVLADSEVVQLEPRFTFHGFRYAGITTTAEILNIEFVVLSSDLTERSTFSCSDPGINKLVENTRWSLRSNFLSIPTDCPQRDERMGWTGDAQIFAPTSCSLVDARAFWASWLRDLALDQDPELGVSTIVPDVVMMGPPRYGRAGWADAATIVPTSVRDAYGAEGVVLQQLHSMRLWVDSLIARRLPSGLLGPGMQFGDWLDPLADSDKPWDSKTDKTFLANAYFARSTRHVADAIARHGSQTPDDADAISYRNLGDNLAALVWNEWSAHIHETQTAAAVALMFDLVPSVEREAVASSLAVSARQRGGRVSTGFIGTGLVLDALAEAGYYEEAYSMLLCRENPSWLYQVDNGATTFWERWDGITPEGSIHTGMMQPPPGSGGPGHDAHILSFNHYAYGAVTSWILRHVAGIRINHDDDGHLIVLLQPRPVSSIRHARAEIVTDSGLASIAWELMPDGRLVVDVAIPHGAVGRFDAPVAGASDIEVDGVDQTSNAPSATLSLAPGLHSKIVRDAVVVAHQD